MTFEQWWVERGGQWINGKDGEDAAHEFAQFCWDAASENAAVEAAQIRKAFVDHYGPSPDFLDSFVRDRLNAIRAQTELSASGMGTENTGPLEP
jgi:hypothetical protein